MQARALIGLVGNNIQKSLSPALHEDALHAVGMSGHYHLMDLDVLKGRRLQDILHAVRRIGFLGINVTHPFKEEVLGLVDEISAEARQIGAANTVVIDRSGRLTAYNTDRIGFRCAFEETLGSDAIRAQSAVLLGAGGAGRAVAFALMDLGAATLHIYDKDHARATALCADLIVRFGAERCQVSIDPAPALELASGVVNATPVGMLGYPGMPISGEPIRRRHWIADIVYTPLKTQFIEAAGAKGCRIMSGAGMCVHQAAEAFRLFTGIAPDVARMRTVFDVLCAKRDALLAAVA